MTVENLQKVLTGKHSSVHPVYGGEQDDVFSQDKDALHSTIRKLKLDPHVANSIATRLGDITHSQLISCFDEHWVYGEKYCQYHKKLETIKEHMETHHFE